MLLMLWSNTNIYRGTGWPEAVTRLRLPQNVSMFEQMLSRRPLGEAIPGRPWTDCGYGLGLMTGSMGDIGRAIGHSGGGPFSVNAVYHFPDCDTPVTVACFTNGEDEGRAEFEAARLAQNE